MKLVYLLYFCPKRENNDLQILKLHLSILANYLLNIDVGFIYLERSFWTNFIDIWSSMGPFYAFWQISFLPGNGKPLIFQSFGNLSRNYWSPGVRLWIITDRSMHLIIYVIKRRNKTIAMIKFLFVNVVYYIFNSNNFQTIHRYTYSMDFFITVFITT